MMGAYSSRLPMLALAAYVALLATPPAIALLQLGDLVQARADMAVQHERLQQIELALGRRPASNRSAPDGKALFEAETATLSAAQMQERVSGLLNRHGATLFASQANATPEGGVSRLQLSADFLLAEPELPGFLYDVEVSRPFLFVESLSIRKREESGDMLRLTLRLYGFARWGL